MSRPPLAPKITDTLYDMYQDAKKVNALDDEGELERKLSTIRAINEKISRQVRLAQQSSRPDPYVLRKLNVALEDNRAIETAVNLALEARRGPASNTLALRKELEEKARQLATLQNELDRITRESQAQQNALNARIQSLEQASNSLRGEIEAKNAQIASLRDIQQRLQQQGQSTETLERRISVLEQEKLALQAQHNQDSIQRAAAIAQKDGELQECRSSLSQEQARVREIESELAMVSQEKQQAEARVRQEEAAMVRLRDQLAEQRRESEQRQSAIEQQIQATQTTAREAQERVRQAEARATAAEARRAEVAQRLQQVLEKEEEKKSDVEEKQGLIEEKQREIQQLQTRIQQLRSQSEASSGRLQEEIRGLKNQLEVVRGEAGFLQSQKEQAETELRELRGQVSIEVQGGREIISNLESTVREKENQLEVARGEAGFLQSQKEQAETELRELRGQVSVEVQGGREIISNLESTVREKEIQISTLEQESERMQQRVNQLQQQIDELQTKLEQKEQEVVSAKENAQEQVTRLTQETQDLESRLREKERELVSIQQAADQRIEEITRQKQEEIDKARQELEKLKKLDAVKAKAQVNQEFSQKKQKEAEEKILDAEQKAEQSVREAQQQMREVQQKAEQEVGQLRQELSRQLGIEVGTKQQEIDTLSEEIRKIQAELAIQKQEVEQERSLKEKCDAESNEIRAELEQTQENLQVVNRDLLSLRAEHQTLQEQHNELEMKEQASKSAYQSAQDRATDCENRIKKLESEKEMAEQSVQSKDQTEVRLQQELTEVQQEMEKLATELEKHVTELKSKEDELERKEALLSQQRDRVEELRNNLDEVKTKAGGEKEQLEKQLEAKIQELQNQLQEVQREKQREIENKIDELQAAIQEKEQAALKKLKEKEAEFEKTLSTTSTQTKEQVQQKLKEIHDASSKAIAEKEAQLAAKEEELKALQMDRKGEEKLASERMKEIEKELKAEQEKCKKEREEYEAEKQQIQDSYTASRDSLQSEIAALKEQKATLEQTLESARSEFEKVKGELQERLRLSEEDKQTLDTLVKEFQKTAPTPDELRNLVQQKDAEIAHLKEVVEQMGSTTMQNVNANREELTALRQSMQDLSQQHEQELKEIAEKTLEKSLLEINNKQRQIDEYKLREENLMQEIENLNMKQKELVQSLEEKQQQIAEIEKKLESSDKRCSDRLAEKCPKALGDLIEVVREGWDKAMVIEVLEEELQLMENTMKATLQYYEKLSQTATEISVNREAYGSKGLRQYVLPCVYMFHSWKALMRISVILRDPCQLSDGGDKCSDVYMYKIPEEDDDDNSAGKRLMDLLGSVSIKNNFRGKILKDKMRLDVLLYFIIIALTKPSDIDKRPDQAQYKPLIEYIRKLLNYAQTQVSKSVDRINKVQAAAFNNIQKTHNTRTPILTFIRMSSKTPDTNKRFKYSVVDDQILNIEYSDQPVSFYAKDNRGDMIETDEKIEYNADYHFGPYTHIFGHRESNADIVESSIFTRTIEDQLREGKPVCIIGYGASGSGKTTTLVYADYMTPTGRVQQPGVLILLANQLALARKDKAGYDKCSVKIYELEADPAIKNEKDVKGVCRKYPSKGSDKKIFRVTRTGADQFLENDVPYEECKEESDSAFEYEYDKDGSQWISVVDKKGIQEELVTYINVKRNVAPSPNNPQSSRSHIICVLNFSDSTQKAVPTSLIVCDFAGVENKFNCEDKASLNNMGIPRFIELQKKSVIESAVPRLKISDNLLEMSILSAVNNQFDQEFSYITKDKVAVLDSDKLQECLDYCVAVAEKFNKIQLNVGSTDRIQYGKWKGDAEAKTNTKFDITSITTYTAITNSTEELKAFKDGLVLKPVYNPISESFGEKNSTYKFLNSQYLAFKNDAPVGGVSIPHIIRLVSWFLYSYNLPNGYSIANVMRQTALSADIRSKVEVPQDNARYLLSGATIESFIKVSICKTRVNEGIFINSSLADLRKFIGDTMQKAKGFNDVAPFIDQCAPLQCNPYYRDCFGQNLFYDESETRKEILPVNAYGLLSEYIMKVPGSQNMIFCVINVINLSKDANNPPPSPYIDISDIQLEYERLLPTLPPSNQDPNLGMSIKTSTPSQRLLDAVERLENNSLLKLKNVSADFVTDIKKDIKYIKDQKTDLRLLVQNLIRKMTNFNSITAIGTLEFTDTMAKYAINRVTCNTRKPVAFVAPQSPAIVIEEEQKSQPPSIPSTPIKTFDRSKSRSSERTIPPPQFPQASQPADTTKTKSTRRSADFMAMEEAANLLKSSDQKLPRGVVRKSAQGK